MPDEFLAADGSVIDPFATDAAAAEGAQSGATQLAAAPTTQRGDGVYLPGWLVLTLAGATVLSAVAFAAWSAHRVRVLRAAVE